MLCNRFEKLLCERQEGVTVFLSNGVKLSGVIVHVGQGYFFLSRDGMHQKVNTHAVATIMPGDAISLQDIRAAHSEQRNSERVG
jgi:RNA chaperone Hfq